MAAQGREHGHERCAIDHAEAAGRENRHAAALHLRGDHVAEAERQGPGDGRASPISASVLIGARELRIEHRGDAEEAERGAEQRPLVDRRAEHGAPRRMLITDASEKMTESRPDVTHCARNRTARNSCRTVRDRARQQEMVASGKASRSPRDGGEGEHDRRSHDKAPHHRNVRRALCRPGNDARSRKSPRRT